MNEKSHESHLSDPDSVLSIDPIDTAPDQTAICIFRPLINDQQIQNLVDLLSSEDRNITKILDDNHIALFNLEEKIIDQFESKDILKDTLIILLYAHQNNLFIIYYVFVRILQSIGYYGVKGYSVFDNRVVKLLCECLLQNLSQNSQIFIDSAVKILKNGNRYVIDYVRGPILIIRGNSTDELIIIKGINLPDGSKINKLPKIISRKKRRRSPKLPERNKNISSTSKDLVLELRLAIADLDLT